MNSTRSPECYKIRADAFFVATNDGVWLRNNQGSFSIKGRASYTLIQFLFVQLDGQQTVDEICAKLDPKKRQVITQLIATLEQRKFLKRVVLPPEDVPPWTEQLYADQLHFIDQYTDRPFASFMQLRRQQILCVGQGRSLTALLIALLEVGAGSVKICQTTAVSEERAMLAQIIEAATQRDPLQQLELVDLPFDQADVAQTLSQAGPADCVLFAADTGDLGFTQHLGAAAAAQGAVFGVISPINDLLVVSPLFAPDSKVCWECLYRSINASQTADEQPGPVSPTATTMAGQQMIHSLLCYYVNIPWDASDKCSIINSETLGLRTHTVTQHPACRSHPSISYQPIQISSIEDSIVRPDLPSPEESAELLDIQDDIVAHIGAWTDERVGPFLSVGEQDLDQVPLSASSSRISIPQSTTRQSATHTIVLQGISARETRNQVALLGLEWLTHNVLCLNGTTTLESATSQPALIDIGKTVVTTGIDGTPRSVNIGAGWSVGEAQYRALSNLSQDWLIRQGRKPQGGHIPLSSFQDERIGAYVCKLLTHCNISEPEVSVELVPTGLFVSTAALPSGVRGYGTGVTEIQAGINALLNLIVMQNVQQVHEQQATYSVQLTLGLQSWQSALARAEARCQAGSFSWWNISQMLQFAADRVSIVALEVVEG